MKTKHLVLGATGSMGFAYTNELLNNGVETSILVRDRNKALGLFQNNPLLHIHTGDVNDPAVLESASEGMEVIFFGINYPYHQWERKMKPITRAVINFAIRNQATILFPGNIYSYGYQSEPIREDSPGEPSTRKGQLRYEMEEMLQEAATRNKCRVINVRMPDFWGPNVTNGLIKPLFGNAAENKSMQWLIRSDVKHQFVYTPDAGRLFHRLTLETSLPSYFVLNYGGQVVPSISWLGERISKIAESPAKLKVYSRRILKFLGLFVPQVRELIENFYQFEHCIVLDDSRLRSMYPDWRDTSMEKGIEETIRWFRTNQKP